MGEKRHYPFVKAFEAGLALALVTVPRFYEAVGRAVDHERMPTDAAGLVVKAAKAIAKDGNICSSRMIATQRIRSWVEAGKISFEELGDAEALLDFAEDIEACSDIDALLGEVVPVVQQFAKQEAVEATISDYGKGIDSIVVAERFESIASIGHRRGSSAEPMTGTEADILASVQQYAGERLPTGVADLDYLLHGGLERKALGVAIGGTGAGKSLFMAHIVADAVFAGIDAVYFTLELSAATVKARVYQNLLNMSATQMSGDPALAARRYADMRVGRTLGRLEVVYETAQATTVADLRRWLKERERDAAFHPQLVVVDMGDHLVTKTGSEKRSYDEMRVVYSGLREIAVERDGWAWTCSHVKSGNEGRRRIAVDQAADSMHKSRLADLIVSMPRTEDDQRDGCVRFGVPKRRIDTAHGECGPLPMDAEHGRMVAMSRGLPWG